MVILGGCLFLMSEVPLELASGVKGLGWSLTRKRPPTWEPHRSLGTVLLYGPTGWRFLMSGELL